MKKKILLSILTVLLMITLLFTLTACGDKDGEDKKDKSSSSEQAQVIEDYFKNLNDFKFSKAFEAIDWVAYGMVDDDYEYDEIEDEYDEYYEDNKDDFDLMYDNLDRIGSMYDGLEDYEKFSIEVTDIGEAKKVSGTKNIYKVDTEVKYTYQEYEDDDKETENYDLTVYVMKKDGDYYIIYGIDDIMNDLS